MKKRTIFDARKEQSHFSLIRLPKIIFLGSLAIVISIVGFILLQKKYSLGGYLSRLWTGGAVE